MSHLRGWHRANCDGRVEIPDTPGDAASCTICDLAEYVCRRRHPGRWYHSSPPWGPPCGGCVEVAEIADQWIERTGKTREPEHAFRDVPALIAEVERLRADNVSMTEVIQAIVPAHERACAERDEARAALDRVFAALDQAENGEDPYIGRSGLIRLVRAALDGDAPHTDTTKDTQ